MKKLSINKPHTEMTIETIDITETMDIIEETDMAATTMAMIITIITIPDILLVQVHIDLLLLKRNILPKETSKS